VLEISIHLNWANKYKQPIDEARRERERERERKIEQRM